MSLPVFVGNLEAFLNLLIKYNKKTTEAFGYIAVSEKFIKIFNAKLKCVVYYRQFENDVWIQDKIENRSPNSNENSEIRWLDEKSHLGKVRLRIRINSN